MEKVIKYFVYGKEMSPKIFKKLNIKILDIKDAKLRNYKIVYNVIDPEHPYCSMANLIPSTNTFVEGIVYFIDIKNNNKFKEYLKSQNYDIKEINVEVDNIPTLSFTYVGNPDKLFLNNRDKNVHQTYLSYMLDVQDRISPTYITTMFPKAVKFKSQDNVYENFLEFVENNL